MTTGLRSLPRNGSALIIVRGRIHVAAPTETAHHSPKASPEAHYISCRGPEIRHVPCGNIGRPSVFTVMTHHSDAKCNQIVNRSSGDIERKLLRSAIACGSSTLRHVGQRHVDYRLNISSSALNSLYVSRRSRQRESLLPQHGLHVFCSLY